MVRYANIVKALEIGDVPKECLPYLCVCVGDHKGEKASPTLNDSKVGDPSSIIKVGMENALCP